MAKLVYLAAISAVILLQSLSVDCIDGSYIVKLHNNVRHLILEGKVPGQPKGKNLVDMQWDNQLAAQAQRHAEECVFAHDDPQDARFYVGQNIFVSGSTQPHSNENWKDAVDAWYNEYKDYKYSNTFNPRAGHYTQLVWHNTQYVGCGFAYCPEKPHFQNYLVCNYGPGGNMEGEYPYELA